MYRHSLFTLHARLHTYTHNTNIHTYMHTYTHKYIHSKCTHISSNSFVLHARYCVLPFYICCQSSRHNCMI